MLQTGHVESERIYAEMVWSLLLMFTGLFIIVTEAQARTADIGSCRARHPARISLEHTTIWLTTDMMSTLLGSFAIVGSRDYFRVGAPLTIFTLVIGTLWMWQ